MMNFTPQGLTALSLFALVSSITPGPNNMMIMASGANFGLRASLPHLLGIGLGFMFMIVAVGLGLGGIFSRYPVLHSVLAVVGAVYLLWLAWKIATATSVSMAQGSGKPMTFMQAAAFQWVNPKAWAMALSATTTYAPTVDYQAGILVVALIFGVINIPSVGVWASFGTLLRGYLDRPAWLRGFNWGMAALLVLSLFPLVGELIKA